MAKILSGKEAADALADKLKKKAQGISPCLAIIRMGQRGDDLAYERGLLNRAEKLGVLVKKYVFNPDEGDALLKQIKEINEDPGINGCLMFRPLEDKKLEDEATKLLSPKKDVDAMTRENLSAVYSGDKGFYPCTPEAVMELLAYYDIPLEGKNVVVVGRSLVIGKPLSMMMLEGNATVTIAHSKTKNLQEICGGADILVSAVGRAGMINKDYLAPGQVVIDVGINVDDSGKVCGDVVFDDAMSITSAVTPVPGGVGSLTNTVLFSHVIDQALSLQC